ncbi:hypothetical protein [Lactococcus lactis]|uniref:Uncharacterized protein n=1 Tax=Lactococcus lactis subsp. lactis TaxID=1360 RepID=A0A2N5W9P2_LACLL|nr:hypothetical protein [Lactococcus lactis]PLW58928.1 hypothetical protein CYU10_002320 [Lactococcus lactis subsp. lactis]
MKIVLNKCFGGFGLSHEAKMMIFEKREIEVFPYLFTFGDEEFLYEKLSNLKVVEIPDGASYEISDYDGIETAHYGFQTGSV